MSGKLVSLKDVPDPVFAEKMLGDGIAILPTEGIVSSPVDGNIAALPSTGHACGIITKSGLELLIHVGIDTVEMQGKGFEALAQRGDTVRTGQTIIEFDLNEIERAGKSPISPVIATNGRIKMLATDSVQRGDPLMEITPDQ